MVHEITGGRALEIIVNASSNASLIRDEIDMMDYFTSFLHKIGVSSVDTCMISAYSIVKYAGRVKKVEILP